MSWDVLLLKYDGKPSEINLEELSHGTITMGDAQEVRDAISRVEPDVNWEDPQWGLLDGFGWTIEFNHHATGPTNNIMLHVRGGGDVLPTIIRICRANEWVAFDTSTGQFIDLDSPSDEGWIGFQNFRDRVLHHIDEEKSQRTRTPKWAYTILGLITISCLLYSIYFIINQ